MAPVKTKVLASSDGPVETTTPAPTATPNPPGTPEPAPEIPAAAPEPSTATPPPEAPNRPGLETPQAPVIPDPFVQLYRWKAGETERTLRAIPIPGGCLVRLSAIKGTPPGPLQITESVCFVPGVQIHDGMLLDIASIPPQKA
jgi:hypothetical protein